MPPACGAQRRFTIGATTYIPDMAKGGRLIVREDDAAALEVEGWSRAKPKGV